ncbi:MAG: NAD(P)/FAD-dependent oxidoreductase [Lewinellaceae bacterium]|nr:NAD(P)/FAD-dependent oxidoreductase [Lewinella sp.]MCB9278136.1 NAD(P)/FAD-dependent oxidoreductase [Lewinellaceae bacterium]
MDHYELLVIGSGPGGVEAARRGADAGLKTALVHNMPLGGRATWSSLLPSKAWLQVAESVHKGLGHPVLGSLIDVPVSLNHEALRAWIQKTAGEQAAFQQQQLESAGVPLIQGTAKWAGPGQVLIANENTPDTTVKYDHLIVSGGSGPRFTPAVKPNMDHIIAPRISPRLNEIPKSMIVMGGGVTGTEYAFAFASMGTEVTILQKNNQLLPTIDAEVVGAFSRYVTGRLPISIKTGVTVAAAEQQGNKVTVTDTEGGVYTADFGFIAISRTPDLSFWPEIPDGLQQLPGGFISVDRWSRTSLPDVYAIGDMTGAPMMANRARSQAREAVRAILGQADDSPAPVTMEAVYTQPNVVQVGSMAPNPKATFHSFNWKGNLKAAINDYAEGLIRVQVDNTTGLVLGAAAFGHHASEVLSPIQLAINEGISWERVVRSPFAHPTLSEVWGG